MTSELYDYQKRTRQLTLSVIEFVDSLPDTCSTTVIGEHLLRAVTAVAANFRAATRTPSRVEIMAKLSAVEEQADLAVFWLETLVEAAIVPESRVAHLRQELNLIMGMSQVAGHSLRDSLKRDSVPDLQRKSKFDKQKSIHG
jgi:four helix bundle protein